MPKQIKAWQCNFCNRYRKTKSSIARHESICFENPDREIIEGQLAIFATMPKELVTVDSYGVPNSEWYKPLSPVPEDLLLKYKWWPLDEHGELGLGYIFKDGEWKKIKGYKPPQFAPGFSCVDEVVPDDERRLTGGNPNWK